ncbi:MAG: aspartate aminotransferase family protein [Planctomycetota bacterium]
MSSESRTIPLPQFDHQPKPYDGPSKEETIALRQQYLSPGLLTYYAEPIMVVEGKMQYVWDEKGQRYLDAFAGIVTVSVGHCHPKVIEKIQAQNQTLQHTTTIYLHPTIGQFAEKLASKMPTNPAGTQLDRTYFTNSGSEANELAILAAREHTGNHTIIALRNGYHGGTATTMGLTAHGTWKFKSNPDQGVVHTRAGYCYRCPYDLDYPSCGLKCAQEIKDVIEYQTHGEIAGFIGEPIQGVGGAVVPPEGFFEMIYKTVRDHGGVCIADEVQGGFGRTGEHYWSHQNWNIKPDIVTMAKGIGNGAPLAAMTATHEISSTLANRIHFNTYGGNPISVTQGLATLEVIDEEGIQENAKAVGTYLKDGLTDLKNKHELIGDVRGMGLMLGVELVKDHKSKKPAKEECAALIEKAKQMGLLLGKGGLYGNTIRLKPPMCITKDDADFIIAVLDECLGSAHH